MNKLIVFFCTGLWHGANWTFVFWGLYHGMFLLLEEYVPAIRKIPKWLGRIYVLLVVCIGFVLFRADSVGQGLVMIKKMFCGFDFSYTTMSIVLQQMNPWFLFMLLIAVIGCAPIHGIADRIRICSSAGLAKLDQKGKAIQISLYICSLLLLAWCLLRLSGNGYNPFIYFKF